MLHWPEESQDRRRNSTRKINCASMETAADHLIGKGNVVKGSEKGGLSSPVVASQGQQSLLLQALQDQITRPMTFSKDMCQQKVHR